MSPKIALVGRVLIELFQQMHLTPQEAIETLEALSKLLRETLDEVTDTSTVKH